MLLVMFQPTPPQPPRSSESYFITPAHPPPPVISGNSGILGILVRNGFATRQKHFHGLGNYWKVIFHKAKLYTSVSQCKSCLPKHNKPPSTVSAFLHTVFTPVYKGVWCPHWQTKIAPWRLRQASERLTFKLYNCWDIRIRNGPSRALLGTVSLIC